MVEEDRLRAEEAEGLRRLQEELEKLTVGDHLLYMMQSLSALAVGRLGLTPDTTGRRDLEQARLAIDALKALVDVVEATRPAEEMAAHRSVLSQLQLSYVGALTGISDVSTERPATSEQSEERG